MPLALPLGQTLPCPPFYASCLPVARPNSRMYARWALLMLLLDLSYTAILCPVSVAFAPRAALVSWVRENAEPGRRWNEAN